MNRRAATSIYVMLVGCSALFGVTTASDAQSRAAKCPKQPGIDRADIGTLQKFNQTRGSSNKATYIISKRQSATLNVTRVDFQTFRVRITDYNRERWDGDTYRNTILFFDKCGTPVFVFYNQRGVSAKLNHSSTRTTHTDSRFVQPERELDKIAFYKFHADAKGDTNRVREELKDAVKKGVLEGIKEFFKKAISSLAPDLKKTFGLK